MGYELNKNAIITNNVNFFCLACNSFLETKQEAYGHVDSAKHCEKIGLAPYSEKYKDHYIRKFVKGYYCAFCNMLVPTAIKVDSHICQEVHKQNRGHSLLKSTGQKIIAYDTVLIKENAWHGLNDNVCSICDSEFEDESKHRSDVTHVLNLIQKSIKFGANDAIYRHIDECTIHCLTCDKIVSLKTNDGHFDDAEHRDIYESCKIKADNTATPTENDSNNQTKLSDKSNPSAVLQKDHKDNVTAIVNSLEKYNRNNIEINIEIGTAFCRKCWIIIEYNHLAIDNHIEKHSIDKKAVRYPTNSYKESDFTDVNLNNSFDTQFKDNSNEPHKETEKSQDDTDSININSDSSNEYESDTTLPLKTNEGITAAEKRSKDDCENTPSTSNNCAKTSGKNDSKSDTEEAIKIAKDNDLTYNAQNANAFCRVCQVRVPSSLKSMKEHIKGVQHNKNCTKNLETPKKEKGETMKKIISKRFIRNLDTIENPFSCTVVINKEYLISDFSFFLIAENDNSNFLKCFLCQTNIFYIPILYKNAIKNHFRSHQSEFHEIPVIKSVPTEFIREIRQGEFHCGFCNVLVMGWSAMEAHLERSSHKEEKTAKCIRLRLLSSLM